MLIETGTEPDAMRLKIDSGCAGLSTVERPFWKARFGGEHVEIARSSSL
jgi:hypothetical protein